MVEMQQCNQPYDHTGLRFFAQMRRQKWWAGGMCICVQKWDEAAL